MRRQHPETSHLELARRCQAALDMYMYDNHRGQTRNPQFCIDVLQVVLPLFN